MRESERGAKAANRILLRFTGPVEGQAGEQDQEKLRDLISKADKAVSHIKDAEAAMGKITNIKFVDLLSQKIEAATPARKKLENLTETWRRALRRP